MNRIISLQSISNVALRNNFNKHTINNNIINCIINRNFHNSNNVKGFEEFYDQKKPNDIMIR